MSLRFRKSLKLAPGIRLNVGSAGVSWNLGPRGASVSIGKRGTYLNSSLSGTGLSARTRLGGPAASKLSERATQSHSQATEKVSLAVEVTDDGEVVLTYSSGAPATAELVKAAKAQKGDHIRGMIAAKCDAINRAIESLGELHLHTPAPTCTPSFAVAPFQVPRPIEPSERPYGLLAKIFTTLRVKVDAHNRTLQDEHATRLSQWESKLWAHQNDSTQRRAAYDSAMAGQPAAMGMLLEQTLHEIVWPQETLVGFDISDDSRRIALDVDLPEIEDLPTKTAAIPSRGMRLLVKEMAKTQVQKLYMRHVHAIGFRLLGETFAALPGVTHISLSAYSQRPDPATGHLRDDYLYSVRLQRDEWGDLNFNSLGSINVVDALSRFELRRKMSTTGLFKPVEPFAPF